MAKKKKKQKPKQGHPARLQGDVVSIERAKVKRGLDALAPQFTRWLEAQHGDSELAPMVLAAVGETLSYYAEAIELRGVTDFDPRKQPLEAPVQLSRTSTELSTLEPVIPYSNTNICITPRQPHNYTYTTPPNQPGTRPTSTARPPLKHRQDGSRGDHDHVRPSLRSSMA